MLAPFFVYRNNWWEKHDLVDNSGLLCKKADLLVFCAYFTILIRSPLSLKRYLHKKVQKTDQEKQPVTKRSILDVKVS